MLVKTKRKRDADYSDSEVHVLHVLPMPSLLRPVLLPTNQIDIPLNEELNVQLRLQLLKPVLSVYWF